MPERQECASVGNPHEQDSGRLQNTSSADARSSVEGHMDETEVMSSTCNSNQNMSHASRLLVVQETYTNLLPLLRGNHMPFRIDGSKMDERLRATTLSRGQ